MYDKTVRRRRAVLGLLVACSLILLTAYFGESAGGALQLGAARRAARSSTRSRRAPAGRSSRSATSSAGSATRSTPRARSRTLEQRARPSCASELVDRDAALRQNTQLRELLELDSDARARRTYGPVTARVIGQSPTVWYSTIDDRQGLERRRARSASRSSRATASSARSRRHARPVDGDADHRRDTIGGLARASTSSGVPGIVAAASAGNPRRPRPQLHAARRRASAPATASSPPAPTPARAPTVAVSRRASRSAGSRASRTRGPTTRASTCARSPTCAASTSSRSSPSRAGRRPPMTPITPQLARAPRRRSALAVGDRADRAVSQLPIVGANADLAPLRRHGASACCAARSPARRFGFGVGLFVDIALAADARRLLARLLAVGYGAGRLREARDPQGDARAARRRRRGDASRSVGFALMQFLLGVDAPVSGVLVRQIARDARPQHAARAARLRARAPLAAARPARRPAPAPAPGLHDRRPLAARSRA